MTRKNVLVVCAAIALALIAGVPRTFAANIVFASDNPPSVTTAGFSAPVAGFADDFWVTNLLQTAGHNVIRYSSADSQNVALSQEHIDALNTNDLIIISRSYLSGAFQTPGQQVIDWNTKITAPIIVMSSYLIRANRLGWIAANAVPDGTPTALRAADLNDPAIAHLFQDVVMNGDMTADPYDEALDRNTSQTTDAPVTGGRVLVTAVAAAWNVVMEWPVGTAVRGGADVLSGYRMFFGSGSRELGTAGNGVDTAGKDNMTPTGEAIWLRAVELAANNGIAPNVTPLPPLIGQQPLSLTVEQFRPAGFSITVTQGTPVLRYQWYFNSNVIVGATGRTLSFTRADTTNTGEYFIVVTNNYGAVTSAPATLTVTQDITAPYIVSVGSLDGRSIGVCFNEELDVTQPALTEAGNYEVNGDGNKVLTVTIRPDGRSVRLDLIDPPLNGPFTLHSAFVQDLAGNAGASDAAGVVRGFTGQDVGSPALAGSHFVCDSNTIEIVGGGVDVWGTTDQFYLASKTVTGDFDARTRVTALRGAEAITKAVLVARETTSGDSRALHLSVNPVSGRNQAEPGQRTATAGASATWGSTFVPAGIPNFWMRITRLGEVFTGYRSTNGLDWIQMGQTNIGAFPADMVVGIGVTAHNAANSLLATGTFSNFTISQSIAPTSTLITGLSYSAGVFSGSFLTQNGVIYEVQYKNNLNDTTWTALPPTISGDGTVKTFTDPGPAVPMRFYRIAVLAVP